MNIRIHKHYYVALGLLVVAFGLGELWFRVLVQYGVGANVPLAARLQTIPLTIGDWAGEDTVISGDTAMKVGAMDTIQRVYRRSRAGRKEELLLYIAYFGGIRGTAPHHPDVCMPGAGWDILNREMPTLRLPGFGNAPLEVHKDEFELRSDQRKRLVVWWEYIHGKNVASRAMQRLKWVLPKFLGGERGSILQVQVSQEYRGNSDASWTTIGEFIEQLGPHLEKVLPKTVPGDAPQATGDR